MFGVEIRRLEWLHAKTSWTLEELMERAQLERLFYKSFRYVVNDTVQPDELNEKY